MFHNCRFAEQRSSFQTGSRGRMISAPTTGQPRYRRDEHCSSAFCGRDSGMTDDRWSSLRREKNQNPAYAPRAGKHPTKGRRGRRPLRTVRQRTHQKNAPGFGSVFPWLCFYFKLSARCRNVTIWALVQIISGANKLSPTPFVIPCVTAHKTGVA